MEKFCSTDFGQLLGADSEKLGKRAESGAFCPNSGIKVPWSRVLRAKNENFQNDKINRPFDRSFNAEQKILIQYGVKTKNFKDMGKLDCAVAQPS